MSAGAVPFPADDPARIAAVDALELLDAPRDERFDRLTRLAARALGTPIAFVSLVGADRWWAVSCFGTEDRELPREQAMCTYALGEQRSLVVPDLRADARFRDNPLVQGDDGLRFYAGIPLAAPSGRRVGTLCVADRRPRSPTSEELGLLEDLAALAERELAAAQLPAAVQGRRDAEARLEAVLETAGEGIVITGPSYVIEEASTEACALLGVLREDLVGRRLAEVVRLADLPDGDLEATRRALRELAGRREGTVGVVAAGGDLVHVSFRAATPRGGGAVVRLRDAASQAAVERARDQFVAGTSHELRTPVTTVLGFAELLEERGDLPADARRHVEAVLRGARRLDALVRELLAAAAAGAAEPPPRSERVELLETARGLAEELAPPPGTGPDVRVEGRPVAVEGDRGRLDEAARQLIANAVKFGGPGTEVVVEVTEADGLAVLAVHDRGPGVPHAELPFLGRRFFRASTARGVPGTGLGLARAQEIAEQHGGRLVVRRRAGGGSTFAVELPAAA